MRCQEIEVRCRARNCNPNDSKIYRRYLNQTEDSQVGLNRRIKTIAALAGLILLTATAASSQAMKAAAKPAPDAEFKKLIAEYYKAWSSMNPNNASKYYAKDAGLVFFDIAPMQYHGWDEYK